MKHLTFLTLLALFTLTTSAADGSWIRFRLEPPVTDPWYVAISAYVHVDPWSIGQKIWPEGADKNSASRIKPGDFTPWFDLKAYGGRRLHGRHNRAGGIAEFPNLVLSFNTPANQPQNITIQLATAPKDDAIVRELKESYTGNRTSILVSPTLRKDAAALETGSEMSNRRLAWARQASSNIRHSTTNLILQTGLWYAQRPELNLQEAEVLWLLGFNTVGGQTPEIRALNRFQLPGHSGIAFGPEQSRTSIDNQMRRLGERVKQNGTAGSPFNFSDEVVSPAIGSNTNALNNFHAWLKAKRIKPRDLGVATLTEVVPIENPKTLFERQQENLAAANRIFYYTSRFRQESATERFCWLNESFHRHVSTNALTSTLPADHPYFAGTGLGMGMGPNPAWGSTPLALDWFDLGRRRALDLIGIEDWMGLQYMYGPSYTWEGFQLMGFQAAIFRSASQGKLPIIAWVTPSDATNLTLKAASALSQGAKHLFFWTYGPTAFGTENYWSDLPGAYDGMVTLSRQRAFAESVLIPASLRPTRVALLYSISSDLWQPFGYTHMLERRFIYLALRHAQYGVDLLSEEDILAGRLTDYTTLYSADPCLRHDTMKLIDRWVYRGGTLVGTCAAGSRNEFNEPATDLNSTFGLTSVTVTHTQEKQPFHIRAAINNTPDLDTIILSPTNQLNAIGIRVVATPTHRAHTTATFSNTAPAIISHKYGRGHTLYFATCPGIAYGKAARFVARELREQWPTHLRTLLTAPINPTTTPPAVHLSHPVVECGVYDTPTATALTLANFTYRTIPNLQITLTLPFLPTTVTSAETGSCKFSTTPLPAQSRHAPPLWNCTFTLPFNLTDIILFHP